MKMHNMVSLIGRLTKDVELKGEGDSRYFSNTLAVDNGKDKDGNDRPADFIPIKAFKGTAETLAKYLKKGQKVGVCGELKTGSYEKDGQKIYTWEVRVESFEFLEPAKKDGEKSNNNDSSNNAGFTPCEDEDLPTSDFMGYFNKQ